MDLSSVVLTTAGSASFFKLLNAGLNTLPLPESAHRNAWKWNNISTSFVHSFITAIWGVLCFFLHPEMAEDLIETHSVFSHALVSFSIGNPALEAGESEYCQCVKFNGGYYDPSKALGVTSDGHVTSPHQQQNKNSS